MEHPPFVDKKQSLTVRSSSSATNQGKVLESSTATLSAALSFSGVLLGFRLETDHHPVLILDGSLTEGLSPLPVYRRKNNHWLDL